MTDLDATPRAAAPTRVQAGPATPTAAAQTAHRPLTGPGAALTDGLLHDWQSATGRPACRWPCASWRRRATWTTCARPPPSGSAGPGAAGYHGPVFMDSDVYKTLEAIGWELARDPDSDTGQTWPASPTPRSPCWSRLSARTAT